jgi:hypothetical protein
MHSSFLGVLGMAADQAREEYIEAEMARRHADETSREEGPERTRTSAPKPSPPPSSRPVFATDTLPARTGRARHAVQMRGRLQEIDLGEEARRRNEAMTERARRRLQGAEAVDDEESDASGAQRKQSRLGPDGKPWRGRKRRASEDARRDELVEAVLRENRSMSPFPPFTELGPLDSGRARE